MASEHPFYLAGQWHRSNDVPTWRIDHMPYGGVNDSGIGREGPRDAIEEMTEPKLLVVNTEAG